MTIIWFMVPEIWSATDNFLAFWTIFCSFTKKSQFEKIKKTPKNIIILHMCTINDNHIMCGYWNTMCNRQYFLSFWTIFCPFTPLTTQKIKILKKWKKAWRYYHFTQVYHKWQSYDVWFLRYEAWLTKFLLSFWTAFCPFTP